MIAETGPLRDDIALLDRMMTELARADPRYQPTNYWQLYQAPVLAELRQLGLAGFRRRRQTLLSTFGATDTRLTADVAVSGRWSARLSPWARRLFAAAPGLTATVPGLALDEITAYFHERVREKFAALGLDLSTCATTMVGDPEDVIERDGGSWSLAHLQHCAMVADALRFIPFTNETVVCEIGAGLGRTVEVLARLFPAATFVVFDLPPQLYVSHQYLTAVFGPRVMPYGSMEETAPGAGPLSKALRGRIFVEPTWRVPAWQRAHVDLFWNSASFQEMEPDVVDNYLSAVTAMAPGHVYINALPGGNSWGEWQPGRGGTKQPVLESTYRRSLEPAYRLAQAYHTDYFMRAPAYRSYVFARETESR